MPMTSLREGKASENIRKKTSKNIRKKTSKNIRKKMSKNIRKKTSKNIRKKTSENIRKKTSILQRLIYINENYVENAIMYTRKQNRCDEKKKKKIENEQNFIKFCSQLSLKIMFNK